MRAEALGLDVVERSRLESSSKLISSLKTALLAFYELEKVRGRREGWGMTNIV